MRAFCFCLEKLSNNGNPPIGRICDIRKKFGMDQKKFTQKMRNKITILATTFLIGMATVSCQKSNAVLEYGNPVDLEKIDWEKQDLDKTFSKIVYAKDINYKKSDSIYNGTKPLKVQWHFNYNADTAFVANRIDDDHFEIIQPNEKLLKADEIYRTYVGVSNEKLEKKGAFGYYIDKNITFNDLETISSGKEDLALIRFGTDIENDSKNALAQYNTLKDVLSKKCKDMKMSVNSLNEYPIYEWKSDKQKYKIAISKGTITDLMEKDKKPREIYTIFFEIIYYNEKTKKHIKGLYN